MGFRTPTSRVLCTCIIWIIIADIQCEASSINNRTLLENGNDELNRNRTLAEYTDAVVVGVVGLTVNVSLITVAVCACVWVKSRWNSQTSQKKEITPESCSVNQNKNNQGGFLQHNKHIYWLQPSPDPILNAEEGSVPILSEKTGPNPILSEETQPSTTLSEEVGTFGFSFSEESQQESNKLLARNDIHFHRYEQKRIGFAFESEKLPSNIDTIVTRGHGRTKVSIVKRSASEVNIKSIPNQFDKKRFSRTIERSNDRRQSGRILAGIEKRDLVNELNIIPFVKSISENNQSFTEVEISLKEGNLSRSLFARQYSSRRKGNALRNIPSDANNTLTSVKAAPSHSQQGFLPSEEDESKLSEVSNSLRSEDKCTSEAVYDHPAVDDRMHCDGNQNSDQITLDHVYVDMQMDVKETEVEYPTPTQTNDWNLEKQLELTKKCMKTKNCNIYHQEMEEEKPRGEGIFFKDFDHNMSRWSVGNSEVHLTVPKGAIGSNLTCRIFRKVNTDLAKFQHLLPEEETFIAPIPEFKCNQQFLKHVKIEITHCLQNYEDWDKIHVQYGENGDFQNAVPLPKANNMKPDVYFVVEPKYVVVYTTHFTQFLCSVSHGLTGCNTHDVKLESMVFGRHSRNGEHEVQLRVYVIDRLHQIPDMKQNLIKEELAQNYHWQRDYCVKTPDEITSNTAFITTLEPKDGLWQPECSPDGNPYLPLSQCHLAKDVIHCHHERKYVPAVTGEFVVVLPKDSNANYFKGNIELKVIQQLNSEKKNTKWLKRFSKKPAGDTVSEKVAVTNMWVNFSFSPSFIEDTVANIDFDNIGDVFKYIADSLPREVVPPLARKLGFQTADWHAIEESWPKDFREQKYQLLLKYREKSGASFTMEKLIGILDEEGMHKVGTTLRNNSLTSVKELNEESSSFGDMDSNKHNIYHEELRFEFGEKTSTDIF